MAHIPVLLKEVLEGLDPTPGEFHVDGTAGGGGHSFEIAKRLSPDGVFIGIDWDEVRVSELSKKTSAKDLNLKKLIFTNGNYADIQEILKDHGLGKIDGLLLDLGFSSDQLGGGRGFSFKGKEEPLIMTYSDDVAPLYQVMPTLGEKELAHIIKDLSDERYAKRIARRIVENRRKKRILTNKDLAELVRDSVPQGYENGRIDPATRTFMAFRIYINKELENLGKFLGQLTEVMAPEGRVAIISYHSKEDEMVKGVFSDMQIEGQATLLNKSAIRPSEEEVQDNPRSRSAKLRVIRIKHDNSSTK